MTYQDFKNEWLNKPIDVDQAYGDQCWDEVAQYNMEVIGVPANQGYGLPTGPDLAAKDVWYYFLDPLPKYFLRVPIAEAQTGYPVVWGEAVGKEGHIAIFDRWLDGSTFVSLDQNWPLGSIVHEQQHNLTGILGALKPLGEPMITRDDVIFLFDKCLGLSASEADIAWGVGKPWNVYMDAILKRPEALVQDADVKYLFEKLLHQEPAQTDYDWGRGRNWRQYMDAFLRRVK